MPSQNMTFQFCPRCGHKELVQRNLKSWHCRKCSFTYFQNCASAVAAVLRYREEILLTVRKNDPGKGRLDLPGGFVDAGESLEEALTREIYEELGFDTHSWHYLFSYPNRYEYKGIVYNTTDAFFKADLDDKPNITACDDVADIIWMPVHHIDLNSIALSSIRKAIHRIKGLA